MTQPTIRSLSELNALAAAALGSGERMAFVSVVIASPGGHLVTLNAWNQDGQTIRVYSFDNRKIPEKALGLILDSYGADLFEGGQASVDVQPAVLG